MLRLSLIISGLVSLVLGIFLTAAPVIATGHTARVLVSQRVELLPQGPLCWRVLQTGLPPGVRDPAEGFAARPLAVAYQQQGEQRIDYAGGPSRTVRAGEGNFIGANNWFARTNIGTVPAPGIVFQLTCAPPSLLAPGTSHIATTPIFSGIRPGPVPYVVELAEGVWSPGAQVTTRVIPGPNTHYVLEGTFAQSTPAGVRHYRAGELIVDAPGTPFELTNVGNTTARELLVRLWPVGERAQLRPDVRLPSPGPVALPRTGEQFPWAGPLAMLVGALLLAAGVGLRRRQV